MTTNNSLVYINSPGTKKALQKRLKLRHEGSLQLFDVEVVFISHARLEISHHIPLPIQGQFALQRPQVMDRHIVLLYDSKVAAGECLVWRFEQQLVRSFGVGPRAALEETETARGGYHWKSGEVLAKRRKATDARLRERLGYLAGLQVGEENYLTRQAAFTHS
jgi:hypothetical protein